MRAIVAQERHTRHLCPNCGNKVKVGEVILHQRINDVSAQPVSANARELVLHASCIQQVLNDAPLPEDKLSVAYRVLREQMERSGRVFSRDD